MATEFIDRSDVIEEAYEFMLAYAGQGLLSDESSEIRKFLERAAEAMKGLAESCSRALTDSEPSRAAYPGFVSLVDRDAQDSLAALELVLGEPVISSQLVDNLNASIHLRALLTDLFLVGEVLSARTRARTREDQSPSRSPTKVETN